MKEIYDSYSVCDPGNKSATKISIMKGIRV
jgi:hypothetical protein